jgi:hypothetical protein
MTDERVYGDWRDARGAMAHYYGPHEPSEVTIARLRGRDDPWSAFDFDDLQRRRDRAFGPQEESP